MILTIELQKAKQTVREYQKVFDAAQVSDLCNVLAEHVGEGYQWRGMHPFCEQEGAQQVAQIFWEPLRNSLKNLQRREHIFFAGMNDVDAGKSQWVCSSGHFMGLFDEAWLGIRPTGKLALLPYAEFHHIEDDIITESALFCDIISLMEQAGQYPLPPQTGSSISKPPPLTNDGIQNASAEPAEAVKTMAILNQMIEDLDKLNKSSEDHCPPEYLARTWHENMSWYGPSGIGATYTIKRYQQQHQYPFREGLTDKVYNGHVTRFAEGNYAGFFGWPNLNNRISGGFLGMPESMHGSEMRIVDIYRRDGDKLAENWVFIDLLHYFAKQGLDLLERNRKLQR